MAEFSKDRDILKYEPILFGDLHLHGQVLTSGSDGVLSGTSFTSSSADFVSSQVSEGGVIYLSSSEEFVDGAFEIISVASASELTISVLRADTGGVPIAPAGGTGLSYRISTFGPQGQEVGLQLMEYFGFGESSSDNDIGQEDILNSNVLRRVSVFAVISSIYALLANGAADEGFWEKSRYYCSLFEKSRERCRLDIDIDGDQVSDITKSYGALNLKRG